MNLVVESPSFIPPFSFKHIKPAGSHLDKHKLMVYGSVSPWFFFYHLFCVSKIQQMQFTRFKKKNFLDHVKVSLNNLFEFAAFHCTVALPLNFFIRRHRRFICYVKQIGFAFCKIFAFGYVCFCPTNFQLLQLKPTVIYSITSQHLKC